MDSRNSLRLCTGDCGEDLKKCCKDILDALGDPRDCNKKSIIDLLCHIKKELPSGNQLIWLLKEILYILGKETTECGDKTIRELLCEILRAIPINSGGICESTCQYSGQEEGIVTYPLNETQKITAIYAAHELDPNAIAIRIGTVDSTGGDFIEECRIQVPGTRIFQTELTHPLVIVPETDRSVQIRAIIPNVGPSEVNLTVFTCVEPK